MGSLGLQQISSEDTLEKPTCLKIVDAALVEIALVPTASVPTAPVQNVLERNERKCLNWNLTTNLEQIEYLVDTKISIITAYSCPFQFILHLPCSTEHADVQQGHHHIHCNNKYIKKQ